MSSSSEPLKVALEPCQLGGTRLVISIGIETLATACEIGLNWYHEPPRWAVTSPQEFAQAMVRQLTAEAEDGTSKVHEMLDRAAEECMEGGEPGIEELAT